MSEQEDIERLRYLQLKAKAQSSDAVQQEEPNIVAKTPSKLENLINQGKDVLKGGARGLVDIPLGIANIVPSVQNISKMIPSLVKTQITGNPKEGREELSKIDYAPDWVKNPISEPETPLGKGVEIGTSLLAPTAISKLGDIPKVAKAVEGASNIGKAGLAKVLNYTSGISEDVYKAILNKPELLGKNYKKTAISNLAEQKAKLASEPTAYLEMKDKYQKLLSDLVSKETRGGVDKLDENDLKRVVEMSNDIDKADNSVNGLQGLKEKWYEQTPQMQFNKQQQGQPISDSFGRVIKGMENNAKKDIANKVPELGEANKEVALFLGKSGKDMEKFQGAKSLFPKDVIPRMAVTGALGLHNPIAAGILETIQTPALQKLAIMGLPKASKAINKVSPFTSAYQSTLGGK